MSEEIWILVTFTAFVTGIIGLSIPLVAIAGLALGLIYIPFIDGSNGGLVALYVMALVINVLFTLVGRARAKG
jgi:hypothetical protein